MNRHGFAQRVANGLALGPAVYPPIQRRQGWRSFPAFALFALALALGLSARASADARLPIQAASEADYPPFAVVTPEGKANGFAVELLRESLRAMGRDVAFRIGPWESIKRDLAEGRIQVLPFMARSSERAKKFDFSIPYLTLPGTIVVRKGDARVRSAADLRHVRVAVMKGDIAEDYVHEKRLAERLVTTETLESALRGLDRGDHDAVVVQKMVAESLLKAHRLSYLETIGEPFGDYQQFCFAVREGDSELLEILNEGLARVTADGTAERLRGEWLAEHPEHPRDLLVAATAGLAVLLSWAIAYAWQRSLRRQVASRTASLTAANERLAQEIGERLATEQALRRTTEEIETIFDNVHSQIAVLDREFRFLRINSAYAASIGRSPASVIGLRHFDLFPHAENEQIFRSVLKTGRTYSVRAKPFEFPDDPGRGVTYWDWTLCALKDGRGNVEGLMCALMDVTEQELQRRAIFDANRRAQAELEKRVRERTAELEAANQELRSFSYSVSHDLRGPLRAINGFSHAIEEDCRGALDDEARSHLARIRGATMTMANLIDGLLKLSQVFHSELQFTEVDLSALARETAAMLRETEPRANIAIQVEPGLIERGDPTLLRVVIENLLTNAWKFTARRERPAIAFGCEIVRGCKVYFVRDNGVGFDMAFVNKLFHPFERLHAQEGFPGTGIGLATVQRVIGRHNGAVWTQAAPDEGATFYFTLHRLPPAGLTSTIAPLLGDLPTMPAPRPQRVLQSARTLS